MERYERQILIPEFGEEGQEKLSNAKVLVLGAGGLGSPALFYLSAAGVGTIGISDYDAVSISNLNRQILYNEQEIGRSKADSALHKILNFNRTIRVISHNIRITENNADDIFGQYDVIVDCVDNLLTRHLVNRHGVKLGKHIIEAGLEGFTGFVMTVKKGEACYGCMHTPLTSSKRKIPVLGATAGVLACLQACECIKVLTSIGEPLYSQALIVDLRTMNFNKAPIRRSQQCPDCSFTD